MTETKRKEKLLSELELIIDETKAIIEQPAFLKIKVRTDAGISAFTENCPLCYKDENNKCRPDCILGTNRSCMNLYWHPYCDFRDTKKEFIKALDFMENFLLNYIHQLPEFCFSETYYEAIQHYIRNLDGIFRKENEGKYGAKIL